MSKGKSQIQAVICCYLAKRKKFVPGTVINCGVGRTSPELDIWEWLLPDVPRIGIDPRWSPRGYWTKIRRQPQLKFALGDGTETSGTYCGACRGLFCSNPAEHVTCRSKVELISLDALAEKEKWRGPFLLWMDIDGSELAALNGARETLKRTGIINVECAFRYGVEFTNQIDAIIRKAGFHKEFELPDCEDRIYIKKWMPTE